MNKEFFEIASKLDWSMKECDRSLDKNKIIRYLDQLCEPYKTVVGTILENTTYVTYNELYSNLLLSLNEFKKKINDNFFYLVLNDKMIKSEHWMVVLLWNELKNMNFDIIGHDTIIELSKDKIEMLLIDDAIYSGISKAHFIDEFTYNLHKHYNISQCSIDSKIHWSIVLSHSTENGEYTVDDFNVTIYKQKELDNFSELFDAHNLDDEELSDKFNIEYINVPALYFDHKVADDMSTFTDIYLHSILPSHTDCSDHNCPHKNNTNTKNQYNKSLFVNDPSRDKINELDDFFSQYLQSLIN